MTQQKATGSLSYMYIGKIIVNKMNKKKQEKVNCINERPP